jgi:predicted NBD/HSP70 family sugar kinase
VTGAEHVVGVDLGGTKIRAVLADVSGRLHAEVTLATPPGGAGAPLLDKVVSAVQQVSALRGGGAARVACTAVGAAGVVDHDRGSLTMAPNLADAHRDGFSEKLAAALGHPVLLENDANAAAVGELHHGRGRALGDFAFLAVGTGLGMGIILNGELVHGTRGAAGEVGFLPFGADPVDPASHRRGPLEEVLAGEQIGLAYERLTGNGCSTPEVFTLATHGDAVADRVLDQHARHLAQAMVAVQAILDPAAFVLGGGIGSRPEWLTRLPPWFERFGHPHINAVTSELGPRAGLLGAVEIARRAARTQATEEMTA